jgi:hypothetical protein
MEACDGSEELADSLDAGIDKASPKVSVANDHIADEMDNNDTHDGGTLMKLVCRGSEIDIPNFVDTARII